MTGKRDVWETIIPGRENNKHKCPKVGVCLRCIEGQGAR